MTECLNCKRHFTPKRKEQIYCSHNCANRALGEKKKKYSLRTCLHCQKEYFPKREEHKFCSKACYDKHYNRTKMKTVICERCGKEFVCRGKRSARYCSEDCRFESRFLFKEGKRRCRICKNILPLSEFARTKYREDSLSHYYPTCRRCKVWEGIKSRAKKENVIFDLKPEDIIIPDKCPVLKIPLFWGGTNNPNNPSVDRKNPNLGYIKSNICVISWRANSIKSDATLEEIQAINDYMKEISQQAD